MILAASSAGSPAMLKTLSRDVAPRVTAKADFGSRQVAASSSITAAFALPSSAGAVTWALSAPPRAFERGAPGPRLGAQFDRHARDGAANERRIARHKARTRCSSR